MLPFPVEYAPYTWVHILTQSQLLFFSALAFCWLKLSNLYPPELPGINIDAEWSYRKGLPALVRWILNAGGAIRLNALDRLQRRLERFLEQIYRHHGPHGVLARAWPTGSMAFWATLLLGAYLIAYYL